MSTAPAPTRHTVTVVARHQASERTLVLTLALAADSDFSCQPGQFIALDAPDGRARCFSVANAVLAGGRIELHINRVPGGAFTPALFAHTQVGDTLQMTGPFGDFALPPERGSPLILVAGGTGWAPIQACLQALASDPVGRHRELHFYWGVRSAADLYAWPEAQRLCAQLPRLRCTPVLDQWAPGQPGRPGPLPHAVMADFDDLSAHDLCACGVPAMIDTLVRDCAAQRGFDPARLVADVFASGEAMPALLAPALPPHEAAALTLRLLTPAGEQAIACMPGDTLLTALRRAGAPITSVCGGKGACGSCLVQTSPDGAPDANQEDLATHLPEPSKREQRLLPSLQARPGQRLACQIPLAAELDGLRLSLLPFNASPNLPPNPGA